mgnify:FL=1
MIAQTLSEEYPSRDLINEFDSAVSSLQNISADDYKILLSSISQESTIKIHKLLHGSISEPEKFNKDIHAIIETERNNKLKTDNKHKIEIQKNNELQKANKNLSRQLSDISQQIADIQESQYLEKIRQEEKNKINKRWIWMCISIIVALAAVIVLQSFPNTTKCIQNSIQLIGGFWGFWGFCNLALNLWSKFKSH